MALHDVPFVDPTTANLLIEAPGEDRIVPVEIAGVIKQLRESELLVLRGSMEDDNEIARWVQYHLPTTGQMVHRSAHVHLKTIGVQGEGVAAAFG